MARAGRGALVVVLVLGLAACSGGDDEQDAAPPARPTPVVTAAQTRATPSPSPSAVVKRRPTRTGAQLGGTFCAFLVREQQRLAGLDRFAALTRLNLDLGATAGRAVDGRSLQAQAAACPGPARRVLRATGLSTFSAL